MTSETEILNLLHIYAEYIDSGDFEAAGRLFEHATVQLRERSIAGTEMTALWTEEVRRYPDGTPRTKHLITNPILEVDEGAGRASCRSYYTVLQQAPGEALQPIICGRYHDEFERVDGRWRFSHRNYGLADLIGDLSQHVPSAAHLAAEDGRD